MTEQPKRKGRPLKAPEPGKRVSLGLKVTPGIKALLDQAARENGRTQSQEAEIRLEQSFGADQAVGGPKVRAITNSMAAAFVHSGQMYARANEHPDWASDAWVDDPMAYNEAMMATIESLVARMPGGTPKREEVEGVLTRAFNQILSSMINSGRW